MLPIPTKEGYTFGGWYWEADFSGTPVVQLEVGASGTLYAKWDTVGGTTTYTEMLLGDVVSTIKMIKNGKIVIYREGKYYDIIGNIIE